jgi:hypothetical protein
MAEVRVEPYSCEIVLEDAEGKVDGPWSLQQLVALRVANGYTEWLKMTVLLFYRIQV